MVVLVVPTFECRQMTLRSYLLNNCAHAYTLCKQMSVQVYPRQSSVNF
jgi:hypothetical protein